MSQQKRVIEPRHVPYILEGLEQCGCSRFNVVILYCGLIIFHSNGMNPQDVERAKQFVEIFLLALHDLKPNSS